MQYSCCLDGQDDGLKFEKPLGHDQFHASLAAAKLATACSIRECQQDLHNSPTTIGQDIHQQRTGQHKLLTTSVLEEPVYRIDVELAAAKGPKVWLEELAAATCCSPGVASTNWLRL
ncbi:hypothetical protein RHMOL_Rhmol13G0084700 [Rhododendron molle]|uniref:Uncharacterized protein n=1 Tax=Rhododendron molle TaxID=49168 RepID=A0ACC0L4Z1_RHOML|nr:hypothetical protein RHMOL_Rhmol13G0084700 [Rhododendron molle]